MANASSDSHQKQGAIAYDPKIYPASPNFSALLMYDSMCLFL